MLHNDYISDIRYRRELQLYGRRTAKRVGISRVIDSVVLPDARHAAVCTWTPNLDILRMLDEESM